ncbi:MAG TPA: flagellar basal body P-ring formation chaperone FlgA [Povalibacter sp.]|uniref:flagellar basal body P-ring formation chaperone FlgA n=1 Tax=Povalibacter sp. TaxID=1962978 RepID=UPI002CDD08AA|nr:flagellar basal body P-ring formation chaperone FlgA [Povalibacter sp.]HMN45268.1 flagellar basal body P-ring formation chaperone FlgA [Povalibacter sp.]
MSISFRWILVTLFFSTCATAQAQIQSLDSIQSAAENGVTALLPETKAKYFVTASRLDPRLRLAQCATPLETTLPGTMPGTARTTVGVRCASPAWSIFVPVTIEVEAQVLVLRRALPRRSPVDAADVELQTRRLSGFAAGLISDTGNLAGRRLRRALPAGSPLTAEVLAPDVLVRRGQSVTLLASTGPFEIRAQGQALSDGSEKERIRVQNVTSRKIVEGVVENSSTVRVDL